ncbi:hypothetical protein LA303_08685 [Candidatus Sulfidibacterium hydrothermale]|uniref:hypothetical protein n=1 Tax=Candidatus Sulfidibacterium hydrothermale TaxID=2875962 RepID=UPI001F0ADFAE|nr:hypothetical protein [Candidatus Sulfidibacterium hydrothermale]UBM61493.1 hypothetical protein LA303_08685 [Candidatus Sulfidibacterium hydrothermale]
MAKKKNTPHQKLFEEIIVKSAMKQEVFLATEEALGLFKTVAGKMADEYAATARKLKPKHDVPMVMEEHGDFEFSIKFGGDILFFLMHSNIFEIPRDHNVMRSTYIKEDPERSYCGIIHIYNFLSDSFKYNRLSDLGYLIGRILINKEKHYFIEGKSELGFLYKNFRTSIITPESADKIVTAAIRYTLGFDLLTPPYDHVKLISVEDMKKTLDTIGLKTGKRLGFRFYPDQEEES